MAVKLPTIKTSISMSIKDSIEMFYGPPGVGKSTFVNDLAEKVLFLSTDRGTRHLSSMRIECLTWQKFEDTIEALHEPKAPKYDIICIDHVDDWASMAEEATCTELDISALSDAGYGKGWKFYKKRMEEQVRKILGVGSGICFIAHEKIMTVKTKIMETQRVMPEMSKSAWKVIVPLADLVGYCGYKTVMVDKGGEKIKQEMRVIYSQPQESIYAKDRTLRSKPEKGWEKLNGKKFAETWSNK